MSKKFFEGQVPGGIPSQEDPSLQKPSHIKFNLGTGFSSFYQNDYYSDDQYFLVTIAVNVGLTGERTEQKVMTQNEINNLSYLGYRIIHVQKIY